MPIRKYGWKPSPPDQRDFKYYASGETLQAMPTSVDLAPQFNVPIRDQGDLGACGPGACANDLQFDGMKQGNSAASVVSSRLYIYYNTRVIMGTVNEDSGVDNRSMMKAIAKWGWCDESLWPYDTNQFTSKPPASCYQQGGNRLVNQYLSVPQTANDTRGCLAQGFPFIFGFTVYESFESNAVAQTGIVPMPGMNERVVGGHDVLIMGYDDVKQRFKFLNDWGAWGEHGSGYGYFPYAYVMNPNLSNDFWTIRWTPTDAPAPTPVPPVPPSPPVPPGPASQKFVAMQLKDSAGTKRTFNLTEV